MKYPYIGKLKSGNSGIVLFCSDSFGAQLNCKGSGWRKEDIGVYSADDDWDEDKFKNITAEYLANTYGEVKSKAHAEFIVKLAENHGYALTGAVDKSNARTFVIDGENKLLFFMRGSSSFNGSTVKKITIPLPPECGERKPKEVIANGKKHTLNSVTGFYDFSVIDIGYATVSTLEKLKMADDYQVISFVDECDGDKDGEWPKVNDEVVLDDDVGIVKLPADAQDYYIVEVNGLYKQCRFGELSKPKTPEQELHDDIAEQLEFITDNTLSADSCCIQIIVDAMLENSISGLEIKRSRNSS